MLINKTRTLVCELTCNPDLEPPTARVDSLSIEKSEFDTVVHACCFLSASASATHSTGSLGGSSGPVVGVLLVAIEGMGAGGNFPQSSEVCFSAGSCSTSGETTATTNPLPRGPLWPQACAEALAVTLTPFGAAVDFHGACT